MFNRIEFTEVNYLCLGIRTPSSVQHLVGVYVNVISSQAGVNICCCYGYT